jgi:hypothetical protein
VDLAESTKHFWFVLFSCPFSSVLARMASEAGPGQSEKLFRGLVERAQSDIGSLGKILQDLHRAHAAYARGRGENSLILLCLTHVLLKT